MKRGRHEGTKARRHEVGLGAVLLVFCVGAAAPVKVVRPEGKEGPFRCYTISPKKKLIVGPEVVTKGIAVRLGEGGACFDTDQLRYAFGWRGGFLDVSGTHLATYKGPDPAYVAGDVEWSTKPSPTKGRYRGMYVHGKDVVLAYELNGREVLDWPTVEEGRFVRYVRVGPGKADVRIPLGTGVPFSFEGFADFKVEVDGTFADVPARDEPILITVAMGKGPAPRPAKDPLTLTTGGPAQWTEAVTTVGVRAKDDAPYVVDSLTVPLENPYGAWMRLTAFDFFPDGKSAAVSTWNGDVWIVSGIDDALKQLKWKRYATGLFETLGLKVVDGKVVVLERSQITRLHDLNGDGEADYFENVCNESPVYSSYHDFAMDLQTDSAGNFYFARCGQRIPADVPMHGALLKVSADGKKTEVVCDGLRAPNGVGVGPNGELAVSDNQGNWIPSSKVNWVKPGGSYGFAPHSKREDAGKRFDAPMLWLPHSVDRSTGQPSWVTSDRFGLPVGQMLLTSYGNASLFVLLHEEVGSQKQAGVVRIPVDFDSGVMRQRFGPTDGQLYLVGLKGFDTKANQDGCFHRVRYTGKPHGLPVKLRTVKSGIELSFSHPLDRASATDVQNFAVEQWNYLWSDKYGSADYSVSDPKKKGRDALDVSKVDLWPDGKTLTIHVPDLTSAMQTGVEVKIKSAAGEPVEWTLYSTINEMP